jgi:3-dehydroquinate dehydratase-1
MTTRSSATVGPRLVGVIASRTDLDRAVRMREPPDLFELRLDRLGGVIDQLERKISRLRAPLIITARHPQEGGANKLSARQRRDLVARFLNYADHVDIELRSAYALRALLSLAEKKKVRRIISFHNFKSTPPQRILLAKARAAQAYGANIFKVATRTDTPVQLARLLNFIANRKLNFPVAAMGIGKLGAISRILLPRAGSALVYASLAAATDIEGQLSLEQHRALGIRRMTKHE